VYLTVYMMSILTRLLKTLNNVSLYILLDVLILNSDHEMDIKWRRSLSRVHGVGLKKDIAGLNLFLFLFLFLLLFLLIM